MQYRQIIYEKKDTIAKISLNRPEVLNAIDERMLIEIGHSLGDTERDTNIRVVIITGKGKAFCAGMDLDFVKKKAKTLSDQEKLFRLANRTVRDAIEELSKPVIAAVNGYALAGGFEIMLACDFAIASEDAKIGDQHINFGLIGPGGGTQRLPRIVGIRKAKEIILTGQLLSGKESEGLGLVNRAVPPGDLESAVAEFASTLADKSPTALRIGKILINRSTQTDYSTAEELELSLARVNAASEDYQKGIKAFEDQKNRK